CESLDDHEIMIGKTLNGTMRNMQLAENQLRHGRKPAYLFCFRRRLPGDNAGAPHGAELPYVFQTLQNGWRPYSGADYELSDILADYWANFARTGDPNGPGIPEWKPYTKDDKRVLMIDTPPYMCERPLPKIQQYKLNYFLTTDDAYSYV
ncbi:MAG: carboxylesterase family protein, partial [Clostridiales bacterium]|nr:carboxylesterase family protein [Clostridiales bacterium]